MKGRRQSEEVIDGGKRRADADSRLLMMKSCVRRASVDPVNERENSSMRSHR